jgi:hypothetical protein
VSKNNGIIGLPNRLAVEIPDREAITDIAG